MPLSAKMHFVDEKSKERLLLQQFYVLILEFFNLVLLTYVIHIRCIACVENCTALICGTYDRRSENGWCLQNTVFILFRK